MKQEKSQRRLLSGFTLIELVIVIAILSMLTGLVVSRTSILSFVSEDNFIRKLRETVEFLHYQAVTDQVFFRLNFEEAGEQQQYAVYQVRVIDDAQRNNDDSSDLGILSVELAAFLSPSIGKTQELASPESMPSLATAVALPGDMKLVGVTTVRGRYLPGHENAYILFSPRGFTDFTVLHFKLAAGDDVTILINPFTGETTRYNEYREFEWSQNQNLAGTL